MMKILKYVMTFDNASGPGIQSLKKDLTGVRGALASVEERAKRTGKSMRNMGVGLSAALTAPLAIVGRDTVRLYDEQIKAQNAVAQAVRSTGKAAGLSKDQLFEMAAGLQKVTTFGDEKILRDLTAPLLTFTKVQDQTFKRAQAVTLDYATMMKTDLKSAAVQVGKALNDPILGITSLSRAGIQFSESQEDVIKSLVKTGDVAAAQAVILGEFEKQYGGQAVAAANSPLGTLDQLSNAIGDLKEDLGEQITPFLGPLTKRVKSATEWFSKLSDQTKKTIVVVGGIAAIVGPVVAALGLVTIGAAALFSGLASLGVVVAGLAASFAGLAVAVLTNPIGLMVVGVVGLVAAIAVLVRRLGGVRETFVQLKAVGVEVFERILAVGSSLSSGLSMVWDTIRAGWFSALASMQGRWAGFLRDVAGAAAYIPGFGDDLQLSLNNAAIAAQSGVYDLDAMANSARGAAAAAGDLSSSLMKSANAPLTSIKKINDTLKETAEDASTAGDAADGMIAALTKAYAKVKDAIVSPGDLPGVGIPEIDIPTSGNGASAAREIDQVSEAAARAKQRADQMNQTFAQTLTSVVTNAKSASAALSDLLSQLANAAFNKAFTMLFDQIGVGDLFGSLVPSANGNVISAGNVVPFARGGVVSAPSVFPMSHGRTGLVGEAGPEAILPLSRGRGGKLGVVAETQGNAGTQVNIYNNSGAEARSESRAGPNGTEILDIHIEGQMAAGRYDSAMRSRTGLSAKKIRRG